MTGSKAQATGMELLLGAVQQLSLAEEIETVQEVVRRVARELAGCDGATFVLRDGDQCYYADEEAIAPLWKGSTFPMETCISGWAMLHRTHAVIPDIYVDDRIPHDAYRPTFVRSLAMFPVRVIDPIAAIGVYWAEEHIVTDAEIGLLQGLANATSIALEKVQVHHRLREAVELRASADLRSITDDLTGLLNRRGFGERSRAAWESSGCTRAAVAFIDVNGLKELNDRHGHDAGDQLLRLVAERLIAAGHPDDVLARLGGDEFAVLSPDQTPAELRLRLNGALASLASVGTASLTAPERLPDALLVADARMYAAKRRSRDARLSAAEVG